MDYDLHNVGIQPSAELQRLVQENKDRNCTNNSRIKSHDAIDSFFKYQISSSECSKSPSVTQQKSTESSQLQFSIERSHVEGGGDLQGSGATLQRPAGEGMQLNRPSKLGKRDYRSPQGRWSMTESMTETC
jgi:hypothetical protein